MSNQKISASEIRALDWLKSIKKRYQYKESLKRQIEEQREKEIALSHQEIGKDINAGIRANNKTDRTGNTAAQICDNLTVLNDKLERAQLEWENDYVILSDCYEDPEIDMRIEEFEVLLYTFFEDMTDAEIMEKIRYSDTSVRRFRKKAVKKVGKYIDKQNRLAENGGIWRDLAK